MADQLIMSEVHWCKTNGGVMKRENVHVNIEQESMPLNAA